jgi:uncharacterized membrane-anchored protein
MLKAIKREIRFWMQDARIFLQDLRKDIGDWLDNDRNLILIRTVFVVASVIAVIAAVTPFIIVALVMG